MPIDSTGCLCLGVSFTLRGIASGLLLFGRFKVVDDVYGIHSLAIAGVLK